MVILFDWDDEDNADQLKMNSIVISCGNSKKKFLFQ